MSLRKGGEIVTDSELPLPLPLPLRQCWPALIVLCVGFFLMLIDQTIVAVATAHLKDELGASYNQAIWVTSIYLLAFAVPLLVTGRLGDVFTQRRMYCAGMALFTATSLACGLVQSIGQLIVARGLQGLAAAMLSPQTMSVINRIFPQSHLGTALGIWGTTAGLAGMTGPILGGLITQYLGWQWIFFCNVPIGIAVTWAAWRTIPVFPQLKRRIDPASILLSLVSVFLMVFALQQGQHSGWAGWIWGTLLAGAGLGVVFLYQQYRAQRNQREPLVPLRIFTNRNFSVGNIGIFMMGITVAGIPLPLMLYFQQVEGLTPARAGLMMIFQAGVSGTLSPLAGRLVDRWKPAALAASGFACLTAAVAVVSTAMIRGLPLAAIACGLVLLGVANAFIWAPNSRMTLGDLPPAWLGAGSGVYNSTRQLGAVMGTATISATLQIGLAAGHGGAAFGIALLVALAAAGIAAATTLFAVIPRRA